MSAELISNRRAVTKNRRFDKCNKAIPPFPEGERPFDEGKLDIRSPTIAKEGLKARDSGECRDNYLNIKGFELNTSSYDDQVPGYIGKRRSRKINSRRQSQVKNNNAGSALNEESGSDEVSSFEDSIFGGNVSSTAVNSVVHDEDTVRVNHANKNFGSLEGGKSSLLEFACGLVMKDIEEKRSRGLSMDDSSGNSSSTSEASNEETSSSEFNSEENSLNDQDMIMTNRSFITTGMESNRGNEATNISVSEKDIEDILMEARDQNIENNDMVMAARSFATIKSTTTTDSGIIGGATDTGNNDMILAACSYVSSRSNITNNGSFTEGVTDMEDNDMIIAARSFVSMKSNVTDNSGVIEGDTETEIDMITAARSFATSKSIEQSHPRGSMEHTMTESSSDDVNLSTTAGRGLKECNKKKRIADCVARIIKVKEEDSIIEDINRSEGEKADAELCITKPVSYYAPDEFDELGNSASKSFEERINDILSKQQEELSKKNVEKGQVGVINNEDDEEDNNFDFYMYDVNEKTEKDEIGVDGKSFDTATISIEKEEEQQEEKGISSGPRISVSVNERINNNLLKELEERNLMMETMTKIIQDNESSYEDVGDNKVMVSSDIDKLMNNALLEQMKKRVLITNSATRNTKKDINASKINNEDDKIIQALTDAEKMLDIDTETKCINSNDDDDRGIKISASTEERISNVLFKKQKERELLMEKISCSFEDEAMSEDLNDQVNQIKLSPSADERLTNVLLKRIDEIALLTETKTSIDENEEAASRSIDDEINILPGIDESISDVLFRQLREKDLMIEIASKSIEEHNTSKNSDGNNDNKTKLSPSADQKLTNVLLKQLHERDLIMKMITKSIQEAVSSKSIANDYSAIKSPVSFRDKVNELKKKVLRENDGKVDKDTNQIITSKSEEERQKQSKSHALRSKYSKSTQKSKKFMAKVRQLLQDLHLAEMREREIEKKLQQSSGESLITTGSNDNDDISSFYKNAKERVLKVAKEKLSRHYSDIAFDPATMFSIPEQETLIEEEKGKKENKNEMTINNRHQQQPSINHDNEIDFEINELSVSFDIDIEINKSIETNDKNVDNENSPDPLLSEYLWRYSHDAYILRTPSIESPEEEEDTMNNLGNADIVDEYCEFSPSINQLSVSEYLSKQRNDPIIASTSLSCDENKETHNKPSGEYSEHNENESSEELVSGIVTCNGTDDVREEAQSKSTDLNNNKTKSIFNPDENISNALLKQAEEKFSTIESATKKIEDNNELGLVSENVDEIDAEIKISPRVDESDKPSEYKEDRGDSEKTIIISNNDKKEAKLETIVANNQSKEIDDEEEITSENINDKEVYVSKSEDDEFEIELSPSVKERIDSALLKHISERNEKKEISKSIENNGTKIELSLNVDEKVNDFSLEQAKGEDLAMKIVTKNTKEEATPECIDDYDDDKYKIQLSSSTEDYIAKLRDNFSHLKEKDLVMETAKESVAEEEDDELSPSTEDYLAKLRCNFSHLKEKDLTMETAKESVAEEEDDEVAFKDMDKLELSPSAEDFVSKLRNGLLNTPSLSR